MHEASGSLSAGSVQAATVLLNSVRAPPTPTPSSELSPPTEMSTGGLIAAHAASAYTATQLHSVHALVLNVWAGRICECTVHASSKCFNRMQRLVSAACQGSDPIATTNPEELPLTEGALLRSAWQRYCTRCNRCWVSQTPASRGGGARHLVDVVVEELLEDFWVEGLLVVDGHVGLLVQNVVKAGCPLAAAQARRVATVVHHEGHPPSVHVRIQRVHSLRTRTHAHMKS